MNYPFKTICCIISSPCHLCNLEYDKVELRTLGNEAAHEVKPHNNATLALALDVIDHLIKGVYILPLLLSNSDRS